MSGDLFDREIRALLEQSMEILTTRYSGVSAALGKGKKEIACLKRYQALYNAWEPSAFHKDFKKLYQKKKSSILKTLDNDSWLRKGDIIIQFGEDIDYSEVSNKCENIKIMLSFIYQCALDLQDTAQTTFDDLSTELLANTKNKDLIRPSIILLHLLRIFYAIGEENDKLHLSSLIETLETDLNVKNRTITPLTTSEPAPVGDGITAIFNMVTGALKQGGVNLPDVPAPTTTQFNEIISSFANNEGIKTAFQSLAQVMGAGGDYSNAQSALQNLLKPEVLQSVQSSIIQTAEIAKENTLAERQNKESQ